MQKTLPVCNEKILCSNMQQYFICPELLDSIFNFLAAQASRSIATSHETEENSIKKFPPPPLTHRRVSRDSGLKTRRIQAPIFEWLLVKGYAHTRMNHLYDPRVVGFCVWVRAVYFTCEQFLALHNCRAGRLLFYVQWTGSSSTATASEN